jgi:hypothetical protein
MVDPSQLPGYSTNPFNTSVPGLTLGTGGLFGGSRFADPRFFPGLAGLGAGLSTPGLVPPPALNQVPASAPSVTPDQIPQQPSSQLPPANTDNGDFLQTVRQVGGNILGGALDVIDLPAKIVARPAFEFLTQPQVAIQKVGEGGFDIWKDINLLNEAFKENQAPGLVKFLGEAALDPLTYLTAGGATAVSKSRLVAPLLKNIPGGVAAAEGLISGLQTYEKAVDDAFKGGSDLVRGIAQNYVPLGTAKDNARNVLSKILPDGLVDNVINSIPNEYTGIPIGPISSAINKAVPNLGLPDILKAPDVRILKTQAAYNSTADATRMAFANRGINIFQPSDLDYGRVLRDIAYRPQTRMNPDGTPELADYVVASVLRNPSVPGKQMIGQLNSAVGGSLGRDVVQPSHQLYFENILQQHLFGPSNGGIDEGTAIQALQQLFNVPNKANPESGQILSDFLRRRDLATTTLIADLSKSEPKTIVDQIAMRANRLTNDRFTLKIDQERAANSYMDQFLNGFDNAYTTIYKNAALRFVIQPVSMLYLGFIGYPIGNAVESYARHIVGGGGIDIPVTTGAFNVENGLLDVPSELFKESSRQAYIAKEISARAAGTPLDYPTELVRERLIDPGSRVEQAVRRHYWNNVLAQEYDNVLFAKGIGARSDFQQWIKTASPLQVDSDPQLAGLSQSIADSVSRMAVKAVSGGERAINGVKSLIDTGMFNREKLTADLLDNAEAANLHPSSRAIISNWTRNGEASSAAANSMIEAVVGNEKKLVEIAPQVLAEKFRGLSDKIVSRAAVPTFNSADLYQNVNDLRALHEQYASIPEMLRMREYETLQANQLKGMDVAGIHDEFAKRLKDSMDSIDKAIQPAYTQLIGQADRLGLREPVESYVNALRGQQAELAGTWSVDAEFRERFFAGKPDRRLSSTWDDPVTGYFPQRRNIWQGFMEKQAVLSQQATEARLGLETAIKNQTARQAAFQEKMANIAAEANPFIPTDVDLKTAGGDSAKALELTKQRARNNYIAANPDDPEAGAKFDAEHVESGIKSGQSVETIAAGISDAGSVEQGIPGTEQSAQISGGASGIENVRPIENGANDITGNGPSADSAANVPTNTFITDEYARADSHRQWLTNQLQQSFANPAMTDAHKQALINYVDNVHRTFESLDNAGKSVLTSGLKEAVARTRERYFQAYINYDDQTVFDFLAKHIFPFWVYESRRWPYLANTAAKFPGLAAAYSNYMDKTDNGYVNIGEIPYDVNPLRGTVLGGINRATGRDMPMRQTQGLQGALESIEQTFGKFGFYMGPHISIPSQIVRGEAGQALPEIFSTAINLGRATNLPGAAGFQELLPDPFRDYYVRQILASQGLEPDHVYQAAADDPQSMESSALDLAQRQAAMVGVVLGQTGVLRYRTPEYQGYLDQKMNAIEKITGISVAQQKTMQQQGIQISQVATLTPAQRQELATLPGTVGFQEVSEPLLNPVAQKLRQQQREFFDAVKGERQRVNGEQTADDQRLAGGIISGVEWRKRYQDRSGRVSDMVNDLKKTEAYKNVPISSDEQVAARQRFNLPALTQSPVDIVLNEYYNIKPETDAVTNDVNWSKFFADRQAVLLKYPAVYDAVKAQIERNDTPQVREFKSAMELLRPYFGIKDQILAQYPQFAQETSYLQYLTNTNPVEAALYRQNSSSIKILNKLVQNYQDAARQQFPQIDAALVKYYGATPSVVSQMGKGGGLFGKGSGSLASATAGVHV